MLLNYNKQIAIFTPFKNWSSSLHAHLHPTREWWLVVGPHPGEYATGMHTNLRLTHTPDLVYYVMLRHPYDRVVSMWKFHRNGWGPDAFEDWFEDWFGPDAPPEPHPLSPASVVYPYDRVIRVEDMPGALEALGIHSKGFPHKNKGLGDHELTQQQKDIIFERHRWDFEIGGYNR